MTEREQMQYYVEIVRTHDENVESRMGPMPERRAERVEMGVQINLNHEHYHTRIVEEI